MFKKILVTTDLSEKSAKALENAFPYLNRRSRSIKVIKCIFMYLAIFLTFNFILSNAAVSQDKDTLPITNATGTLTLVKAAMCEDIKNRSPYNQAVTFSSSLVRVNCFTDFNPVSEKTFIYHKYYFKDELSATKKLTLNPPSWATLSYIQPRETDKGPWRVEIVDAEDNILYILRFSITD